MNKKGKASVPSHAVKESATSGRVTHDERGVAVWEWSVDIESTAARLHLPRLSLNNDELLTPPGAPNLKKSVAENGFDPYETGQIERSQPPSKRDLRELSRWIEIRKRFGLNTKK